MKKFFKIIISLTIISSIIYVIYNYKTEIQTFILDAKTEITEYFAVNNENYYTEKDIEDLISSNESQVNGEYFGKLDNYYYDQLDMYSKIIYKSILNNINELKKGEYEIELPNTLANIIQNEKSKDSINLVFQNAWNALRLDHPEIFDVNVKNIYLTTKTTTIGKKVKYEFYLNSKEKNNIEELYQSESKVELKKEEIINNLNGTNDFAKVLYVHNWLVDNLEYDVSMNNPNNNNIYGALIEKNVVCEGYAKAFKYLLDELQVPCIIVCGDVINDKGYTEKHAWNEVYIGGNWYAVDSTWDDPIIIGGGKLTNELKYKYFLKGSIEIEKNHYENGKMSENANETEFKYPKLSDKNYKKNSE